MKRIRNKFTKEERRMVFSYHEFIKSEWWFKQKADWYSRHKKRCAICKAEENIHLHHKVYPKNGRYLGLSDNSFIALCGKCHFSYHKKHGVKQYMQTTTNRFLRVNRQMQKWGTHKEVTLQHKFK